MLLVKNVTVKFGGLFALKEVSLQVNKGEILGMIGPNGSGKTTLFNVISGVYKPLSGAIIFKNKDITGKSPNQICKMGIARTFQLVRPFWECTVLENVLIGAMFSKQKESKKMTDCTREALDTLEFVGLSNKKNILAKNLNIVELRRLELARALATQPELLLLDEIFAGLNPSEVNESMILIRRIRDKGITIFIIEHVVRAIMNLADRIIVLHLGKKIAEGPPDEIAKDTKVINAYLGTSYVRSK